MVSQYGKIFKANVLIFIKFFSQSAFSLYFSPFLCYNVKKALASRGIKKMKSYKLVGALADALKRIRPKRVYVSAVILAAGSGSRMNSETTKQWMEIGGIPTVVRSLLAFEKCKSIKEIVVCAKADEIQRYDDVKEKYKIKKLKKVVAGKETRQLSSLEGFKNTSNKATFVAIHDAARCLITPEMIEKTVKSAVKNGCAVAATRATDTVKLVNSRDFVTDTPERSTVWLATTPQIFETDVYRASAYVALKDKVSVTDDASMAEHAGFAVKLVDIGKENIKITTKEDVFLAEAILKMRNTVFADEI